MIGTVLIQKALSAVLCVAALAGLPGCGTASAQAKQAEQAPPDAITVGTERQRGFLNDNVYHSDLGDIHYSSYIPESYDGSEPYALFITLPGWEGLYFQGVGANMVEDFGTEAIQYNDKMIVLSTQLNDWGETSADHAIALTEYFLEHYNIDPGKVYLHGMSGGGETGSWVMGKRPGLYAAYLMTSSKWDGDLKALAEARTPVYMATGENDSYYGSDSMKRAYTELYRLYEEQGLSGEEIDRLLVLELKPQSYFTQRGFQDQHAGGQAFARDEAVMGWLFSERAGRTIPEELEYVPEGYDRPAEHPGTLEKLEYQTWESFSYAERFQKLTKTAWVYLPYGYTADQQYNVMYLSHGGWSNEETLMGTPDSPHAFKHIVDHAIEDGEIQPLIMVLPTYNNTSKSDSGSYSLALRLTDNFHNELVNDLIPAVESKYSSYAESTDLEGIAASKDHRGFGGFSMGSMNTWHEVFALAVNEAEAAVVRIIFDKYVHEGYGAQRIATYLTNLGYRTRAGKPWHHATIRGILCNLTYTGVLRCGESRSQVIPELKIIEPELFEAAQHIRTNRAQSAEAERTVPRKIGGQSLLSGNVYCGHCRARLSLTTSGKAYPCKADPNRTIKRIRYICYGKTRKQTECDGPTGYTAHILADIIDKLVRGIFERMRAVPKSEIVNVKYREKMEEHKTLLQAIRADYNKAAADLESLRGEVIKAIHGESAFSKELLGSLIAEAETTCTKLQSQLDNAQADYDNGKAILAALNAQYDDIISWADMYDTASMDAKRMIVNCLIKRVDVYRDYKIHVEFAIGLEQFNCGLDQILIPAA